MPDTDLAGSDADVAERMAELPDDVLGLSDGEATIDSDDDTQAPSDVSDEAQSQQAEGEENEGQDAEAGDPEFEIADPTNPEAKQTLKLSELVQSHREYAAFREQKDAILQNVETQVQQHVQERYGQMEQATRHVAHQLQAALQLVQPPQRPNPMDPKYEYDERGYRLAEYQYQQVMGQYQAAQQLAQQYSQQADGYKAAQTEQREVAELAKVQRLWPEFSKPETVNALIADTQKFYGIPGQELDAMLTDARQALILRDALEARRAKVKGGDIRQKVVAKAAAKPAPVASQSTRTLSKEQAQHMQARKVLKESGGKSLSAAAKAFEKFV